MGIYGLVAPAALVRPFGMTLEGSVPRSEVRAVYGGFGVSMAAVLALAAIDFGSNRAGIMVTVGLALGGMAFGRIVSGLIDGRMPFYPNWFYFGVEALAAAMLLITVPR